MTVRLHLLSVGSYESTNLVRDALLSRHNCGLFAATCASDIYAIPSFQKIDIAVLHDALSHGELRNYAGYVRRHWPSAKILLISSEVEVLDDPLYDEQTSPGLSSESLLGMIERLATSNQRSGQRTMNQEHKQR
jgi:hypothetical protein